MLCEANVPLVLQERHGGRGYGLSNCKVVRPPSNAAEYVKLVEQRANEGLSWAQSLMADAYLFGHPGIEGGIDLAKSVEWLVKAVAQEHTGAQCTYAMFHLDGKKGIPRNPAKAYHLYTMAAKKANVLAIFNMGQMHQRGDGVEQSTQQALDLYVIAANKKYPPACFVLGCFFAEGKVVKQDFKKAHELWTTAAQAGHQEAQQQLEKLQQHLHPESVPKYETTTTDKIKGLKEEDIYRTDACCTCKKLLPKDSASFRPNICCDTLQCQNCYRQEIQENGGKEEPSCCSNCQVKRMDKNSAEYLQSVQQRAEEGKVYAVAAIAEAYMFGHTSGVIKPDLNKAREYLEKAVEGGHTVSMTNLAAFYMDGKKGVPKNYLKAHGLYVRAARLGNFSAVYNLGQMHERGDGVKKDPQEAVALLNMAASKGHPPAQFALGLIFVKGQYTKPNFPLARQLWTAAAKAGFPAAIQNLPKLDGAEQQFKKAEKEMEEQKRAQQMVEGMKTVDDFASSAVEVEVDSMDELQQAMADVETMD